MSKDIKKAELYYFKDSLNDNPLPCFPVKAKSVGGVDYVGVIPQSDLSVYWVRDDEVLRPVDVKHNSTED